GGDVAGPTPPDTVISPIISARPRPAPFQRTFDHPLGGLSCHRLEEVHAHFLAGRKTHLAGWVRRGWHPRTSFPKMGSTGETRRPPAWRTIPLTAAQTAGHCLRSPTAGANREIACSRCPTI